ncbi:oligosaccharide repeat unit polymerase [Bacillus mycoides]|nr:oligosaccharide repeat unit polymerase [Bacillus mycoides]
MNATLFIMSIFLGVGLLSIRLFRDIMNPLFILVVPLVLQYWLYYLFISDTYRITAQTNLLMLTSIFSFIVGFYWIMFLPRIKCSREIYVENAKRHFESVTPIFLILGVIGFLWGGLLALEHGLSGPGNFFFNLRYANTIEGESMGLSGYLLLFLHVIFLAILCFRNMGKIKKKTIILLLLLLLSSAAFTMARTSLLMYLGSALGTYIVSQKYMYNKKFNLKFIFLACIGFVSIAWLFALGTGKTTQSGTNFLFSYIAYPIVAFDQWVLNFPYTTNGSQTFAVFYKVFDALGIHESISLDVGVPRGQFNTFTFMSAPYLDFKEVGVIFVFLFLGILYGSIYKNVRAGKPYWIIFYSIMLYPLIMSFFEYQYNLSSLIYYTIILWCVFVFGRMRDQKGVRSMRVKCHE